MHHAVEFRHELFKMWRESVARSFGDGCEPKRRAARRVHRRLMVRQVHKLVNQIWLPDISDDAAQFLIGCERVLVAITSQCLVVDRNRTLLENFGVVIQFDVTLLWRFAIQRTDERCQELLLLHFVAHFIQQTHRTTCQLLRQLVRVAE